MQAQVAPPRDRHGWVLRPDLGQPCVDPFQQDPGIQEVRHERDPVGPEPHAAVDRLRDGRPGQADPGGLDQRVPRVEPLPEQSGAPCRGRRWRLDRWCPRRPGSSPCSGSASGPAASWARASTASSSSSAAPSGGRSSSSAQPAASRAARSSFGRSSRTWPAGKRKNGSATIRRAPAWRHCRHPSSIDGRPSSPGNSSTENTTVVGAMRSASAAWIRRYSARASASRLPWAIKSNA